MLTYIGLLISLIHPGVVLFPNVCLLEHLINVKRSTKPVQL